MGMAAIVRDLQKRKKAEKRESAWGVCTVTPQLREGEKNDKKISRQEEKTSLKTHQRGVMDTREEEEEQTTQSLICNRDRVGERMKLSTREEKKGR